MKLGLLADIHEHVEELQKAISVLREHGTERFVVLGDVFETGRRIEETAMLLLEVRAVGVWGNHDFGLCLNPSKEVRERYSDTVLGLMGSLQPRLEIDGCHFTHVEPWLDPHKVEDLWYYDGPPDSQAKLAGSFGAVANRICFMAHLHRWFLANPEGPVAWQGDHAVCLDNRSRHLVVVHAVCCGKCAMFDTQTNKLTPFDFAEHDQPGPKYAAELPRLTLCQQPTWHTVNSMSSSRR